MLDALPSVSSDLSRDLVVREVRSAIVDVPTVRKHKLSSTSVTAQNYALVRLRLANGVEGIGEAATLGGPRWSEESVEAMKANIDAYLAPAIVGQRADLFEAAGVRLDQAAKRNARLHRTCKVKIGAQAPEADMARMRHLARALEGQADLIVDANQAWDETVSMRYLPQLAEMGVRLVEQPVPAWNLGAMARLRARPGTPPLLADECVFDHHDMLAVAQAAAADAGSLKLVKHAGLLGVRKVAAVAEAAGIGLYGGCLLESSVGVAAHLQLFSTFRELAWGCEHFGPQILTGEYVTEPLRFEDFHVHLPTGPGIGVVLDEDKLRHYARS